MNLKIIASIKIINQENEELIKELGEGLSINEETINLFKDNNTLKYYLHDIWLGSLSDRVIKEILK